MSIHAFRLSACLSLLLAAGAVASHAGPAGDNPSAVAVRSSPLGGGSTAEDAAPTVDVLTTAGVANADTGDAGVFTLSLSAPATTKFKVKYVLGGSAVNGADYAALSGKATFKIGKSSVDVRVVPTAAPVGVQIQEYKKTVTLKLKPGTGYTVGTAKRAKLMVVQSFTIILP